MAERMVGFLKYDSPDEVWVNPRHVVVVHQPFEGATLECVEEKAVTVAGTPAGVAAALAGAPESEERAGKAEPDGATASGGALITNDDKMTGDFVARLSAEFAAEMPNAGKVSHAEPPRSWLHARISGDDSDKVRIVRAMLHDYGHLVDAYVASPASDGTVLRMDLGFNDPQVHRLAEAKIAELALGAMEGGAGAIPDSIFTSFPVEFGWLIAEETIHLIDAFEGALMSRDLETPAKSQLVAALQEHAGGDAAATGERRFWALSAVEKVQRMTDRQCEWLRGWVYGWYDGTGEPEDGPGGEP